jgi:predicted RNA binding protein YcfA (HicA-like mRNA interferase family)
MKSLSGRDFARLVEQRGWRLLRISGSHHIYGKTGSIVRLSIPIHGKPPTQNRSDPPLGETRRNPRRGVAIKESRPQE